MVERIAEDLRRLPGVADTLDTIGGGGSQAVNTASIYVKLKPVEGRALTQQELMTRARELLKKYPQELRTSVQPVAGVGGGGARNSDIQYVISGPDLDEMPQRYRLTICPPVIFNLIGTIFHREWSDTESQELGFYRDEDGSAKCYAVGSNAPGDFSFIHEIETDSDWELLGFRTALIPE